MKGEGEREVMSEQLCVYLAVLTAYDSACDFIDKKTANAHRL